MKYDIKGTTMAALEITLDKGESVFTETGSMAWMTEHMDMSTGARGGLGRLVGRMIAGESLFLTTYSAKRDDSHVVFASKAPGAIVPVELADGQSIIAQRDAFMCATDGTDLAVHFRRRLGAGLFGGEGFVMQKLTGPGTAFIDVGGEVVKYDLERGEVVKVNPGFVAMYEPSVDYSIAMVSGISNLFFGSEGLFLATLKGPGTIWLQTLPIANLAASVLAYMPPPEDQQAEVQEVDHTHDDN